MAGMSNHRALLLGPLLLLALAACSGAGTSDHSLEGKFGGASAENPFIVFSADGTMSGNDGCNNFTGRWERDAHEVHLDVGAMTLMACPDVDTWLSRAAHGTLEDSTLTLRDAQDRTLGSLERHDSSG